jgi:hypothetical protein
MSDFIAKVQKILEPLSVEAIEERKIAEYVFELARHQVTLAHIMQDPKAAVDTLCQSIQELSAAVAEDES